MRGGVHPNFNKEVSTKQPIKSLPIPPQLIIPIHQHMGEQATLTVALGDSVLKGQPLSTITPAQRSAIIHAPSSGVVSAIEPHPLPHASGMSGLCIVIDTDGQDQWHESYGANRLTLVDALAAPSPTLLQKIELAGIVGLGGAAFPSAVKLATTGRRIETLIINAAECEPYISCDDRLMRECADEIIAGIALLMHLLNAQRCLIGIEDNKPQANAALQEALANAIEAHPEKYTSIAIKMVPTQYPSGDARQLTQLLTGIQNPKNVHSADSGVLCHNIATAQAVYGALVLDKPLISRVVTITGDGVAQPNNVRALIGTPVSYIIKQLGGYTNKAERMILGGPMMGFAVPSDELPIVKACNCILVSSLGALALSDDNVASDKVAPDEKQAMPCIRCNKCAQVCPVNLLPQQLYWYARAHDFEKTVAHKLTDCIECGACDYVCPSYIPLVDYFKFAKTEIKSQQQALLKSAKSRERFEFNELRKIRIKQARDKKRQAHKAALIKKKAEAASMNDDAVTDSLDLEKTTKQDAIKAAMARAKAKKAAIKASEEKGHNHDAI